LDVVVVLQQLRIWLSSACWSMSRLHSSQSASLAAKPTSRILAERRETSCAMRAIFNHVNKKMHVWLDRTRDVLLTASCGGTWSSSSSCVWAAMVDVMALVGFVELTLLLAWVVLCVCVVCV
jgi:hypothetical protein